MSDSFFGTVGEYIGAAARECFDRVTTLVEDGLAAAKKGLESIEEVLAEEMPTIIAAGLIGCVLQKIAAPHIPEMVVFPVFASGAVAVKRYTLSLS
jgi:hypothetical protein